MMSGHGADPVGAKPARRAVSMSGRAGQVVG